MKVKEEKITKTKAIETALKQVDFEDTFSTTNHVDNLETVAHLIFGTFPKWVSVLMNIRNTLMKPFGLKVDMPKNPEVNYTVGSSTGFFKIFDIKDDELLIGADDKHLNFRVSLHNSKEPNYNIKVTTLVEYNNTFGKLYMTIVKPFHRVIVKSMVKRAFKGITS